MTCTNYRSAAVTYMSVIRHAFGISCAAASRSSGSAGHLNHAAFHIRSAPTATPRRLYTSNIEGTEDLSRGPSAPPPPRFSISRRPHDRETHTGKRQTRDRYGSDRVAFRPGSSTESARPVLTTKPAPREPWASQKDALKKKFAEEGWRPRKRLSPDALDGIRALHQQYPDKYTTPVLAEQFEVSPEAIRRILKSKWRPNEEETLDRRKRWAKRHDKIWDQMAEIGVRPQRGSKSREPASAEDVDDLLPPQARHDLAVRR